jgi:inorganic triphosphatase YgiF
VRVRGGVVELAFDEGWITAGDRRLPVCEVEVELLRGRASAVFKVAGRWQRRFGLVVDPRTKAERGDRLAEGATQALPRKAATVRLARAMTPVQALRVIAAECADQVVRNAADLALGVGGDDHVHQLRVGLRRLRSAWRFFDGWTPPPPEALVQGAQALFTEMGHCRDASVQTGEVVTRLLAAGMPGNPTVHASPARPAAQVASDTQTQAWLLSLYQWAEDLREPESPPATEAAEGPAAAGAEAASPPRPDLRRLVMRRLRRWHGRLAVGGQAFRDLPAEQQHLLRKRAKRLRYAAEFAATLMAAKPLERYLGRLARLQAVLGELNDLEVARERYGQPGATDPAIWFAQGWIAAMREALLANAAREFDKLGQAGPDGR